MHAVSSSPDLPAGTVTLLFTDIEGSTERWERYRGAMRPALERHDAAIRAAVVRNGGRVFKTVGDASCAAFATASDAVAAALAAQHAINAEDWSEVDGLRVRMAVHTGPVDLRDGDYFGPAVNRVARLLAIGHGGQVLVSGVAKELAEGAMPPQATLRDLGEHRLKDLTQPEQIYQLVAPGLLLAFPPLQSLEAVPNNLPLQLTSFVGREKDVADVQGLLAESRMVTLVGSGGVGKTRLALQIGAEVLDEYPDGVWFVEFAPLPDGALVTTTLANVFLIRPQGDHPLFETLVGALRNRKLLLVLDNCEHVVAETAAIVDALLRSCPQVRIVATSREGLGMEGETVVRVPSLAVPAADTALTAQAGADYAGIALFAERAVASNQHFRLTDGNVGVVADVCRQLDGIPLAIELAATRVNVLSVEQLASRLTERFRILTGGRRTALPRQQTMRALIDWSYDLLTKNERAVFARASLFAGTFSLDAASDICADVGIQSWDVLDLLSSLVNKSLLQTELVGSEQRFHMLVSTRQYALERLADSGERETLQRRHAVWYLAFAEQMDQTYLRTPTRRWLAQINPEWDNLRAAIDWGMAVDADIALRVMNALKWAWIQGSRTSETLVRLPQAIAEAAEDRVKVRLLYAYTIALSNASLYRDSRTIGEQSLALARALGDAEGVGLAITGIARAAFTDPTYDFDAALIEATEIFEALDNRRFVGVCSFLRARSAWVLFEDPTARRLLTEALEIARSTGDERTAELVLNNLGELTFWAGEIDTAITCATESIEYATGLHDAPVLASDHNNLSAYYLKRGDRQRSLALAREALRISRNAELRFSVYLLSLHFGALAAFAGDVERAAKLDGRAIAAYDAAHNNLEQTEQWLHDTIRSVALEKISEERFARLAQQGAQLSDDELIAEMLAVTTGT